jgi:hypothetical protein
MKFKVSTHVRMVFALALVAGFVGLTLSLSPGAASASPRSGELHLTKDCTGYTGLAGGFCIIASSNLKAIPAGSTITYASAATAAGIDSNIVIDVGHGNNTVLGHCTFQPPITYYPGLCTLSGGTGEFTHFHASLAVTFDPSFIPVTNRLFDLDGTYFFSPPN